MYCAFCGKQIGNNDAFCPCCGKPTPQSDVLAGAAATGTAAVAGGLGALKVGLIALAAVAVVGLGVFGAARIFSRSAATQETSTIRNVIVREESAPTDEALE